MADTAARRKRINRLKKIILATVVLAILIPVIISVVLGVRLHSMSKRINELEGMLKEAQSAESAKEVGVFTTEHVEESPRETSAEELIKGSSTQADNRQDYDKRVYLTFDDGPSSNTGAILDVLQEYNVKATFFVVGKTDEDSKALYQRIVQEGHTLGMHSYSHQYKKVYESKESFIADLTKLQEYLYDVTGVWVRYYRFPGGSSNKVSQADMQQLVAYLNEKDIVYYDWNITSGDASSRVLAKDKIVENCLKKIDEQDDNIILLHDAAKKETTVEALGEIITGIRKRGDTVFLPITDDTPKVQHLVDNE